MLTSFLVGLFNLYEDLYFTYLEINPLGKSLKQPTPPHSRHGWRHGHPPRLLIQFFPMSWHCCFALWRPKTNHFQFKEKSKRWMTKNKSYVKNILHFICLFSFISKGRTLVSKKNIIECFEEIDCWLINMDAVWWWLGMFHWALINNPCVPYGICSWVMNWVSNFLWCSCLGFCLYE